MIGARVHKAEAIARGGKVRRQALDVGLQRIVKINGNGPSKGAGKLIHQAAGLSEPDILRAAANQSQLRRRKGLPLAEGVENAADQKLEGR